MSQMKVSSQLLNWIKFSVAPPLAARIIRLLGHTMRLYTVGEETVDELYRQDKRIIVAFWHGRQLMMPLAYRGRLASILISQHRDGEIIARIMHFFGFRSIRGSSTRGGLRAVRQLVQAGLAGGDLVVTPDGPKGPACKVQSGVMYLAKMTGLPIIPLTFACSKKKSLQVGTNFKFLIRAEKAYLCGEGLYGSNPIWRMRSWPVGGWSWSTR